MNRYAIIRFAGLAVSTATCLTGAILATFLTLVTALLFGPPLHQHYEELLFVIPGAGIIFWIAGIAGLAVLERRRLRPNTEQSP